MLKFRGFMKNITLAAMFIVFSTATTYSAEEAKPLTITEASNPNNVREAFFQKALSRFQDEYSLHRMNVIDEEGKTVPVLFTYKALGISSDKEYSAFALECLKQHNGTRLVSMLQRLYQPYQKHNEKKQTRSLPLKPGKSLEDTEWSLEEALILQAMRLSLELQHQKRNVIDSIEGISLESKNKIYKMETKE